MTPRIVEILYQMIAFLFAISVHESAHAWTASRCGDPTARMLGRVSLNPIRHIDLFGTIILPLVAALSHIPLLGWAKPTPVDPRNFRNPVMDDILTSVAGPVSNFIVATGALLLLGGISLSSASGHALVTGLAGSFGGAASDSSLAHRYAAVRAHDHQHRSGGLQSDPRPAARRQPRAAAFLIGSSANGVRPHWFLRTAGAGLSGARSYQRLDRPVCSLLPLNSGQILNDISFQETRAQRNAPDRQTSPGKLRWCARKLGPHAGAV